MAAAAKKAGQQATATGAQSGQVRVFFATNRDVTGSPPAGFGNLPNGQHAELRFGEGEVTIAKPERFLRAIPPLAQLRIYPEDAAQNVYGSAYLISELDRLALDERNDATASLVIYVHGFATSFAEALGCAAQIRHNIGIVGDGAGTLLKPVALSFSWPSDGVLVKDGSILKAYWTDADDAALSGAALMRLLVRLSEWADARFASALDLHRSAGGTGRMPRRVPINLMVQSMGHQVLAGALQRLASRPLRLDHVVSSGADIEAAALSANGALSALTGIARDVTVYNNLRDGPLSQSQLRHGNMPRLGQTGPQDPVAGANAVAVDVTRAANYAWDKTGHFYNRHSQAVCADYVQVLADLAPYEIAGRQPNGGNGQRYAL